MSWFVVCCGNTDWSELDNMFKSIYHRGTIYQLYLSVPLERDPLYFYHLRKEVR